MPLTNLPNDKLYYAAAVYRLEDTCVRLQEGMEGYYRTASVEAVDGIQPVFRWFARRGVKNILLTSLDNQDLESIVQRLEWTEDFQQQHLLEITSSPAEEQNPFEKLIQDLSVHDGRQLITIGDTPDFLRKSREAGVMINLGVTYGSCNYRQLADSPKTGLLDNILQLPNFIIENGISQETKTEASRQGFNLLPANAPMRLYLRLPFF